jgi:hypothetical protein
MIQRPAAARYVLPETTALAAIGCLDLLSTVYLLATHQAHEANPWMSGILTSFGPGGFVAFKALLLGGPLAIAEIARRKREAFVRTWLRIGIALYLGFYALFFLRYNLHL